MQSAQFRAVISAARGKTDPSSSASNAALEDSFKDENGVPFGMVHCNGCNRNFNPEPGARHIAICKDIKAKPKMLVRGGGKNGSNGGKR